MGEITVVAGDAVSKLLQIRAKQAHVHLKWTGKGVDDMDALCREYFNRKTLNDCLWNGLRELMAMPELKELPEAMQAQIMSIILKAQALFELRVQGNLPKPTGVPL